MQSHTIGLILGGIIPAFIFGIGNVLVKSATNTSLHPGYLVLFAGLGFVVVGVVTLLLLPEHIFASQGAFYSFVFGLCMAGGSVAVSVAIAKYAAPVSALTPLYNMNTLVAVLLALWLFAEWQNVKVPQLLLGSVLIVIGGTLVAKA